MTQFVSIGSSHRSSVLKVRHVAIISVYWFSYGQPASESLFNRYHPGVREGNQRENIHFPSKRWNVVWSPPRFRRHTTHRSRVITIPKTLPHAGREHVYACSACTLVGHEPWFRFTLRLCGCSSNEIAFGLSFHSTESGRHSNHSDIQFFSVVPCVLAQNIVPSLRACALLLHPMTYVLFTLQG